MSSVQAFNSVLEEFLGELETTFPENEMMKTKITSIKKSLHEEPKMVLQSFVKDTNNQAIVGRDESYINESKFIKELHINEEWENVSKNTKDAIWQYLNTLYVLGTTINSIPENMLSTIENIAEQCASQFNGENMSSDNMGNLLAGMQNMLGNMFQAQPSTSSNKKKNKKKKLQSIENK